MNTHEIAIQNKLNEIINFHITDLNKKTFIRKRIFTFQICILSLLFNGAAGFSLGVII